MNYFDPKQILSWYKNKPESFWLTQRKNIQISLFKKMGVDVKAYRKFLAGVRIKPAKIKKYEDLNSIPSINKNNYFRKFSSEELCWKKIFNTVPLVVTATSGSTGTPSYFLRSAKIDLQYSVLAEFFLRNGPTGPTLFLDCFGMGVWIGGLITYQAFRYAGLRGKYPLAIITPGVNKKEIFHALKELASSFDNVILAGYPPFIKDILDEAKEEKINFSKFHTRLLFAAESFTENFRNYVAKIAGIRDVYRDTLNIYGSAELGAMAFETPTSVFIRRLALKHPDIYEKLFVKNKLPTLAQYNPFFVNFDEKDGKILVSADSAMPLFRYSIGDNGGVYSFKEIENIFSGEGINLRAEAVKAGINLLSLPFVYVYERSDFSASLYGLQIYPQTIKRALEDPVIQKLLTGKFIMETMYNKDSNQFLAIRLEMKPKAKLRGNFRGIVKQSISRQLLNEGSEYRELTKMLGFARTAPHLYFYEFNDPKYFRTGIKQKWVKK